MRTRRDVFLLSILFGAAGLMHFVIPNRYVGIMPAWIPYQLELVYISGVAEFLGGVGLLLPRFRKAAGVGLIILLIAVFPANVQMLSNAMKDGSSAIYITLLFFRLPLQPMLIVWIYRVAVRKSSAETAQGPRTSL